MPLIPEKVVSCFVDTDESGRLGRSYWRKGSAMLLTLANVVGFAVDTREKRNKICYRTRLRVFPLLVGYKQNNKFSIIRIFFVPEFLGNIPHKNGDDLSIQLAVTRNKKNSHKTSDIVPLTYEVATR